MTLRKSIQVTENRSQPVWPGNRFGPYRGLLPGFALSSLRLFVVFPTVFSRLPMDPSAQSVLPSEPRACLPFGQSPDVAEVCHSESERRVLSCTSAEQIVG